MSEHAFQLWKTAAKTVLGFSINLKYNGRWLVSQTAVAKQQKLSGQTKKTQEDVCVYQVNVNGRDCTSCSDKKLLEFLRDDLHLTGTKNGCAEGACGACTVIVNGKKTKACVPLLSKINGAKVITIEGLSEREKAVYSYAFAKAGAVQCGFCIPGMIISAKALIDENDNPTADEVKKAIRGNICRCTGYVKIEKAILLAAKLIRENAEIPEEDDDAQISGRIMRIDAKEKALGTGIYTDDIHLEGMLYGKCLRSPYPRARVLSIDASQAERHPSCVKVLTAEDVPVNIHGHIVKDWPVFIEKGSVTAYTGDAICMAVSTDESSLEEILSLVKVEYEELEGVFSAQEALEEKISVHEGRQNLFSHEKIVRGNAERELESCAHRVSLHFSTGHTEHAFMEPECAVAEYDPACDGVIVHTSGQSIYDEQREICHMLDLPPERVRCISALVGGGFGGKEDMSVQHHAALAAWLLKRPVKVRLTRQESLLVHPKRHPMELDIALGCDEKGRLKALKCRILADSGAYASLGGPVLQRACTHAAGPYNYQNISIEGFGLYTNNVPSGAFRGFGVTQSCYAIEEAIDVLAAQLPMDPFEFRLLNALSPGDIMPNGQIAGPDTGIRECLEAVRTAYYRSGRTGIACALKNSGIGVGNVDEGRCILSVENGRVHIRTSAACMGQGLATVVMQITAEATKLPPQSFIVEPPDTSRTPDSGTSTASRQTAFTGEAARRAAVQLAGDLKTHSLRDLEGREYSAVFGFDTDPIDSDKPNPVSHLAYSYSAQVAELDENGKLVRITAACDAGTVINQTSIEGQIEGGVVMGIGYALSEKFITEKGIVKSRYGTLGLLRSTDVPEIETILVHGPGTSPYAYGAKGVGELCTIPTAPAIGNALFRRDGKLRNRLPMQIQP